MVFEILLLLLGTLSISQVSCTVEVEWNDTISKSMFGFFSTPYANLGSNGIKGLLYYYHENTSSCNSTIPPPWLSDNTTNSLLLLPNYDDSYCILERILLARGVGYYGIVTYTLNNSNLTITETIINTGIPIAIVDYSKLKGYINTITVTANNTNTIVSVYGTIEYGLIAVGFGFVGFLCCCCCAVICSCLFYKLCRDYHDDPREEYRYLLDAERGGRNRQELIESILRHLQEMERDIGAQTPLGPESINKFIKREYGRDGKKDEQHETCTICVEDFKEGVIVRQLPCQHIFHPECIDEWLSRHSSLCPMCKINLREVSSSTLPRLGVIEQEGHMRHTGSSNSTSRSSSSNSLVISEPLPSHGSRSV